MSFCRDPIYLYCSISDLNLYCSCPEHHGEGFFKIVVPEGKSINEFALRHMKEHYLRYMEEGEYTKADLLHSHIQYHILWNLPIFGWFFKRLSGWIDDWVENEEWAKFSEWWA